MSKDDRVHVLYVDSNSDQQQSFVERFPDLPVRFADQIPSTLDEVCAAVVIDHQLLLQEEPPSWLNEQQRFLVTTYSNEAVSPLPDTRPVYRLADGPADRFAVRSFIVSAVKRLDPTFATLATLVDEASAEVVTSLEKAREDLGAAISNLGRVTGKLQRG